MREVSVILYDHSFYSYMTCPSFRAPASLNHLEGNVLATLLSARHVTQQYSVGPQAAPAAQNLGAVAAAILVASSLIKL